MPLRCITQLSPTPGTEETLLDGSHTQLLLIQSLWVTDLSGGGAAFRLRLARGGAASDNKQYLCYDEAVEATHTFRLDTPFSLNPGDKLYFYIASGSCAVSVFAE